MLDDFLVRALLAGLGVAAIAGPLGCFIVWRRMAYFGDTLSHSALLGVALGLILGTNVMVGVFLVAAVIAFSLLVLERREELPVDAILGILSHSTLALGLVIIAFLSSLRIDLMVYLFGDVLAVSEWDLVVTYAGGFIVLALLIVNWRSLLAATINHDLAAVEGQNPLRARIVFMLLVAIVIAVAMKIVGVLLITALLIIPPAAARPFVRSPEGMAVLASILGMAAVVIGLFGSLHWDTPSGPSIAVAAFFLFMLSLLPFAGRNRYF